MVVPVVVPVVMPREMLKWENELGGGLGLWGGKRFPKYGWQCHCTIEAHCEGWFGFHWNVVSCQAQYQHFLKGRGIVAKPTFSIVAVLFGIGIGNGPRPVGFQEWTIFQTFPGCHRIEVLTFLCRRG